MSQNGVQIFVVRVAVTTDPFYFAQVCNCCLARALGAWLYIAKKCFKASFEEALVRAPQPSRWDVDSNPTAVIGCGCAAYFGSVASYRLSSLVV